MPTHLHTGDPSAATIPVTSVPNGLTRKQPLVMRSGPLPNIPCYALASIQRINPNLIYFVPQPKEHLSLDHKHKR